MIKIYFYRETEFEGHIYPSGWYYRRANGRMCHTRFATLQEILNEEETLRNSG